MLRDDPTSEFTSTSGPFRVSLLGLHLHRDRKFIDGPWVEIDRFGQRFGVESDDHHGDFVTFFGEHGSYGRTADVVHAVGPRAADRGPR